MTPDSLPLTPNIVLIGPDAIIGNKCKIQNNVSVYKGVTLEDGVFCGPSMVSWIPAVYSGECRMRQRYDDI
jgi:hypothetical protein